MTVPHSGSPTHGGPVVRHDWKVHRPQGEPVDVRGPHLDVSRCAVAARPTLCARYGRQVIVLGSTCATGAAHVRDETAFVPPDRLVHIGTVAHCPVYADQEAVTICPHTGLILDAHASANGRPVFVTLPESAAEWQQRAFNGRTRGLSFATHRPARASQTARVG